MISEIVKLEKKFSFAYLSMAKDGTFHVKNVGKEQTTYTQQV